MDIAALDGVPELYQRLAAAIETLEAVPALCRQLHAAVDRVGALVASADRDGEVAFAAARLDDLRYALGHGPGKALADVPELLLLTRRGSLREGGERREAELAAQRPPRLRLAAGG